MDRKLSVGFNSELRELSDRYAYLVYNYSRSFPREEQFGLTSQLRRSSLSVVLNTIEGYARRGDKEYRQFLKIAYGSLKESEYLVSFSYKQDYLDKKHCDELLKLANRIGAMLWGTISRL